MRVSSILFSIICLTLLTFTIIEKIDALLEEISFQANTLRIMLNHLGYALYLLKCSSQDSKSSKAYKIWHQCCPESNNSKRCMTNKVHWFASISVWQTGENEGAYSLSKHHKSLWEFGQFSSVTYKVPLKLFWSSVIVNVKQIRKKKRTLDKKPTKIRLHVSNFENAFHASSDIENCPRG